MSSYLIFFLFFLAKDLLLLKHHFIVDSLEVEVGQNAEDIGHIIGILHRAHQYFFHGQGAKPQKCRILEGQKWAEQIQKFKEEKRKLKKGVQNNGGYSHLWTKQTHWTGLKFGGRRIFFNFKKLIFRFFKPTSKCPKSNFTGIKNFKKKIIPYFTVLIFFPENGTVSIFEGDPKTIQCKKKS